MSVPEAKFRINVKEGSVELEGNEQFVDKHLEKFEEIFKFAIQEAVKYKFENTVTQLEKEEYYNNDLVRTPRVVTNKGCIKLKSSAIDLVQIIQRN